MMGCAKVVWTFYVCCFVLFSFFTLYTFSYVYTCVTVILYCRVCVCECVCVMARSHIFANLEGVAAERG